MKGITEKCISFQMPKFMSSASYFRMIPARLGMISGCLTRNGGMCQDHSGMGWPVTHVTPKSDIVGMKATYPEWPSKWGNMSNDRFYDEILKYITEYGETGVNVLARELNVPLSTMQRYLEKQTYFRKTVNRKWDIPDNVEKDIKSNTATLMVESVETVIKLIESQVSELQLQLQAALMPINTLKRAVIATNPSVATKINPLFETVQEDANNVYEAIKGNKSNIPEEYLDLILNVDLVRIILKKGADYYKDTFISALSGLILKETDELPDEILELIEHCQKTWYIVINWGILEK